MLHPVQQQILVLSHYFINESKMKTWNVKVITGGDKPRESAPALQFPSAECFSLFQLVVLV